ncbi:metallophosphoesterase [Desulfococcaceae bacterium HSG8]|nr:metallophosphoesterase [Desulfococcaceae bacterium HSG8]
MFLLVFFLVYTFMHTMFFLRARVILPDGRLAYWLSHLFLLLMILAPVASRVLEKNGHDLTARISAFIGFYWMGFIFLAFVGAFLMNVFDLFSRIMNYAFRFNIPLLSGKLPVIVMTGFVIALCIYGAIAARGITTEHIHIVTDKLPAGMERLRIVQISDVHLGLITRSRRLKIITGKVKSLSPDILVCTGDLVDGRIDHIPELSELLNQVRPRYGKYAVTGNHEYYAGIDYSLEFMKQSGFIVLRGETKVIQGIINIAGFDDPSIYRSFHEKHILSFADNDLFTLLLRHQPIVPEETLGLFDLQLSGHTHGGQIFPFNFIVGIPFPYLRGYYELPKGSGIYTNRGTGTWGPQIRVLSPPEITVVEVINSQ